MKTVQLHVVKILITTMLITVNSQVLSLRLNIIGI
jgi:hypothetical protein